MEVTNRFKGLDVIDRVPEELWTEVHDIVEKAVIKTRKGKIYPFESRVSKNSKEK